MKPIHHSKEQSRQKKLMKESSKLMSKLCDLYNSLPLRPIHHSKLKKGDLIYVESKYQGINDNLPMVSYLGEVVLVNRVGVSGKIGNEHFAEFGHFSNIYLIERGYFL